MEPLFNVNGLMFWTEREIRLRRQFEDHFAFTMQQILLETNPAWRMIQIEGPLLTPWANINPNYTDEDVWSQELDESESMGPCNGCGNLIPRDDATRLALRPETTPSSYVYACHLLNNHSGTKPPFVVWQSGKSFRREQDQVTKNMRLKEFWQQEFQCIYTADTMNDYHEAVLGPVQNMIGEMVGGLTRVVESDRLPSYSEVTMDVEVLSPDFKWMEVCSISRRTDFPQKAKFQAKKKTVEKDLLVLEVAIGLDRCVYNFNRRGE